jgi:hypothetical protein
LVVNAWKGERSSFHKPFLFTPFLFFQSYLSIYLSIYLSLFPLLYSQDFRAKLLGPTDPADASEYSLRGKVKAEWATLGLAAAPDVGDNGVHGSASPFEAMAERLNWCKVRIDHLFSVILVQGG